MKERVNYTRFKKAPTMSTIIKSKWWPPKPSFDPLDTNEKLWEAFGKFEYIHTPLPGNQEHITVTDNWVKLNIVRVNIPQLENVDQPVQLFNKKIKFQLLAIWKDWENEGLLHLVKTFNGSYDPRFRRGDTTKLSCHAFGSAFDINSKWNQMGEVPALVGQKGSVRKLVTIANDHGFFWGGHFPDGYWDGMHFEAAVIYKPKKKKPIRIRKKEQKFAKGPKKKKPG